MLDSNSLRDYYWRDVRYQSFYQVVDTVVEDIQSLVWVKSKKTKRRLKGEQLEKLTYSVEKLIRDSVAVVLSGKDMPNCAIAKSKMRYERNRDDPFLTYDIFINRAYKGMAELGYLYEAETGFFDRNPNKSKFSKSRFSRYRAEKKLIELFTKSDRETFPVIVPPRTIVPLVVQQKVINEEGISKQVMLRFDETSLTSRLCANLEIINTALSRFWYDIEVTNDLMSELQKQLTSQNYRDQGKDYILDLSHRRLYRVFNDTAFETGGRFYGGWWQNIPKRFRSNISIDGKPTVEFDYSSLHPSMLYVREGLEPPKDSYALIIQEHFREKGTKNPELRSLLKTAFNAMLNAPKTLRNPPNGINPSEFGLKWSEISNAVMQTHAPIAQYFYTGHGIKMQKIDSDIAELVLLHFAKRNIPILPLHDSFIMHHGFAKELSDAMKVSFSKVISGSIDVDQKQLERLPSLPEAEPSEDDLKDIMDLLGQGYMKREEKFREMERSS